MKILHILAAAGFAVASLAAAAPAQAQHLRDQPGWNDNRGGHQADWDRGRGHGWDRGGGPHDRRCHTEWRYHHRARVCR